PAMRQAHHVGEPTFSGVRLDGEGGLLGGWSRRRRGAGLDLWRGICIPATDHGQRQREKNPCFHLLIRSSMVHTTPGIRETICGVRTDRTSRMGVGKGKPGEKPPTPSVGGRRSARAI